ncbi:E3 ubiquitin-protein ligase PRT6 [Rosa rugosa]|uniref:E3 ubiquitin-protein ligase PRT6 n=1 Tax=Rosa rugosa TaxID=74645 RepID=UPI002B416B14|nr:E3 ubiquitin-protein ligase PRT6 [Rosa rugosa]XP_062002176.1 E3 ubiquitin-protein ligase PRT6 [Rosa rugosa]
MSTMDIDSPSESPPRDRIVQRLTLLGVPQNLLHLHQLGLVAYVKNNKQLLPRLVSAILPPDEEVAEVLREAKPGSKKQSAGVTMKLQFRESISWLKWLMFESDPGLVLKGLSKMSVGQRGICGAVWGHNDIAFRCKTCEHDPTCAICVPCFKNGNHKDHDYSIIYTGGGCCDCGDVTAWKRQGFCSKHKGAEQIQPLPEELAVTVGPVLHCLFAYMKNKLLLSETACRENPRVTDLAAERKKVANELTYFVVEMLLDFCKCSESLLSFVSKMILSSVDFLGILVRAERFLSDAVVKKLHELLLKLMGEPVFKYEFAKVFLNYYPTVVSEAIKEFTDLTLKKYPLLSIFSVQIFTVPTLTPRLVKEMNLLSMLLGCLEDIFNSCAGEDGRLQVTKWSNLYDVTIRVIEDFRFVMSHAIVPKYVTHEQQDIARTWMRLSAFVQGMNPQKRETGLHIEEENDNMHLPFVLGHSIANLHSLLVDGAFSVASDKTGEDLFLGTNKQDMDDTDSLRHAKVGRLSQESSACSAMASSSFACALTFSEDKSNTLSTIPSSVVWLTFECLRAIENWLGVDNTSGTILHVSSSSTSNFSGSNFSALKRTLSKIRKGKNIFGRFASSSEDHGKHSSPHLLSSSDMSVDFQNGKISENKLMVMDEIDQANACNSSGSGDSAMEIDGPMDLDALRVLSSSDWPDITYDVSSQDISVHIPLHRLLALLLQRSLRRCFGEVPDSVRASSANLSSSISTDFFGNILGGCHPCGFSAFVMEHPLRIRVFCAEVHAGMWRKNGDAAPLTCEWYRSVRWSEQFVELDLFLLQCCAALAPADLYIKRIIERFGLSSYLSLNLERSSEYEPVLVQEMLTLIIQIIKERRFCGLTKAESVKRELIHKLSIADATHSQLVKSLPRDLTKYDQLNEILDTVAVYSNPSGFNQGTYSLQWTFWEELDLYYHRWNSRDLQAAEERYLRFRSVSALTNQLPRWTKIYPPFRGLARIGTCKTVLQIVRAVLFYAVFSDKSVESRAPDGVLLTALHLLSLALDICSQHKESGDHSCYDGDFIPVLAFACEEINEGLYFEAGQQSLLSLLVILMRMYSKEGLDNSEDGSCNLSSLIGNLLKKFAFIDCECMTKLQVLAPELVSHVTFPNSDTVTSGSASDSEKRKAKARERQAAILEKMRAEQSKFLSSIDSSVDDGSEAEQKDVESDLEDNSEEPAQVVCSLCHDPNSKNPISFLVLLQKSRLLSFIDRGPLSWGQPRSVDKEHVVKTKDEVIDQSGISRLFSGSGFVSSSHVRQLVSEHYNRKKVTGESGTSTLSSGSGVVSPHHLRQLVEKAVTEFARHGRPRDVDAFLEVLKGRFHDLRNFQVPCESNDERESTLYAFETMEEDMYFSIRRELHDKLHSKLTEDKKCTTAEGDRENTEHTEFMLLGNYIAALSRERREDPSSSESDPNDKGPVECSRLSAYDGFGPADCDGIYISSCGHAVHQDCLDRYLSSLKERYLRRIVFEGGHIVDPDKGEFLCPVCRRLANSVLPTLPSEFQKVRKEPMDTGVSSSRVTSPSCKPGEGISSFQQGLALLQSAANAAGKVGTLKGFPLHRCEQMSSNLEPISRLLSKMYFPTDLDKISGSDRVSHPMLMWDLIKYSLLSMEIASRSGGKYAAPSYSLNALYKELESSSRFILSLLLKLVQNTCKNSLHVLQRFIAIQSFAESTCFGVSIDHGSKTSGQVVMLRILEHVDNPVAYPDFQFWNRASDPVLARDPFSSLMWVLFCLPYRFLSCEDSLLSLVHIFYVVSVVQGIATYFGKNQCDISGLGVGDCLITDISKLMSEFGSARQYFVSNYIDSSSNIKNIVRTLTFPYLRRCALLLKLLESYAQAPFCERYNALDRSRATSDTMDTTYVPLVELNEIQEIETLLRIPTLDVILKDEVVRSLAHKWFCHFGKDFEDERFQGSIHCNPAVPFQLMRLPRVYQDLLQRYIKQRCRDCNNILDEPALCLLCGRLCSPSWKSCCRESGCQTHAVACGSGTGVFLLIRRTTILLQRSARQAPWPSPYLDAFGEEDIEMQRGKPLFLNEERYAALTYLVASHGLDRSSKVLGQTTIGSFFMV